MTDYILDTFNQWNQAIQTGNPEEVVKLYAENAVLLPTLSNTVCDSREKILNYFKHFVSKGPKATIEQSHSRELGDACLYCGVYSFSFADGSSAVARYSFVYQNINGEWKILEHHSSLMPEG